MVRNATYWDAPRPHLERLELVIVEDEEQRLNTVISDGTGTVPTTLFPPESPYFRDIPLQQHDQAQAQALLDELAAEGTPVEFVLTIHSTPISQRTAPPGVRPRGGRCAVRPGPPHGRTVRCAHLGRLVRRVR